METIDPFYIIEAKAPVVPLIISIPHCGVEFPEEIKENYIPEQLADIDDTDWFLEQLYDFAPELGVTIIRAKYSRWAIDLNRDPESAPLYNDGRLITGLTSTTDFLGNPIYKEGKEPDPEEVNRRLENYYWPYYKKVEELLNARKAEFGQALLWDAHSIREFVPTIRAEKFPEMILGNAEETSANQEFIQTALKELRKDYQVNHNDPFKGGHITRYFGNPQNNIHALQLERNKNLYMDDAERTYHPDRANKMRITLMRTLEELIKALKG